VARRRPARPTPGSATPRLAGVPPSTRWIDRRSGRAARPGVLAAFMGLALVTCGCVAGPAPATPPIVPGRADAPREVNLIARDYSFVPATLDLVPGETVLLHVIDAGLEVHEAIIGDAPVQQAWEAAEAATTGAPPGPTGPGEPRRRAHRRALRRTGRSCLDRAGRPSNGDAASWRLGRRLPHPRALDEGDVDPDPLGRQGHAMRCLGGTLCLPRRWGVGAEPRGGSG
jgi:hypothetical protein